MDTHTLKTSGKPPPFLCISIQDKADMSNFNEAFSIIQVTKDKAQAGERGREAQY